MRDLTERVQAFLEEFRENGADNGKLRKMRDEAVRALQSVVIPLAALGTPVVHQCCRAAFGKHHSGIELLEHLCRKWLEG